MQRHSSTDPITRSDALITSEEAALLLGLKEETLHRWRVLKKGPDFVRVSPRAVRYRRSAIEKFIQDRSVTSNTRVASLGSHTLAVYATR